VSFVGRGPLKKATTDESKPLRNKPNCFQKGTERKLERAGKQGKKVHTAPDYGADEGGSVQE